MEKGPAEKFQFNLKAMSNFYQNYTNTWLALLAKMRTKSFFSNLNFIALDFHATSKLAARSTAEAAMHHHLRPKSGK